MNLQNISSSTITFRILFRGLAGGNPNNHSVRVSYTLDRSPVICPNPAGGLYYLEKYYEHTKIIFKLSGKHWGSNQ